MSLGSRVEFTALSMILNSLQAFVNASGEC